MTPEEKLQSLGYTLEKATSFKEGIELGVITGNLLYLCGATPPDRFGTKWVGKVGSVYTLEEGYQAARETAVQQLTMAWTILGDLGRIKQVVKLLGMVNCAPGFHNTPGVIHGASDLYLEVLGDRGRHARSAVGMFTLPGDVPVEVETIFEFA